MFFAIGLNGLQDYIIIIMKFYINHTIKAEIFNPLSIEETLEEYLCRQEITRLLFSNTGIYKFSDNKNALNKITYVDKPIEKVEHYVKDNLTLFKDDSFTRTDKDETTCIPFNHVIKVIRKNVYQTSHKAPVLFVIEINETDNKIHNYYFLTKEEHTNKFVQDDISTFLSLIK